MAKHKKIIVNLDSPYEANTIGMGGILYFSGGLLALIVVTFFLMWFMLGVMESDAAASKSSSNPLELTKEEALPPEPRLQAAPGFGVETKNGFKKLELGAPQDEYRELLSQWNELWEKGAKDEKTGTVISLPIDDAKRRLLAQSAGKTEKSSADESSMMMSDSSAGREAGVRVR